jgi:hypothetical protein
MEQQNPPWQQSQAAILHVDPEPEPIPFQPAKITNNLIHTRTNTYHNINQYTKICKIGEGKHGHVYLCRDPNGNESVSLPHWIVVILLIYTIGICVIIGYEKDQEGQSKGKENEVLEENSAG